MEHFNQDCIDVYLSLYQSAKTKKVKAPKKIYKSGKRTYETTTTGIYFLYYGSVCTYVGRSTSSIEARLYKHKFTKQGWNYARVIEIADYKNSINSMEYFFINMFSPFYNIQDSEQAYEYLLNDDYKKEREKVNSYIYEYDTNFKQTLDERSTK